MWHCPHCGAPQAETARCWVCHRSSTTCSTCRHFRTSLAADVGYCALDRAKRPLTGLELRGCWTARPAAVDGQSTTRTPRRPVPVVHRPDLPLRDFVPLDEDAVAAVDPTTPIIMLGDTLESWEARTSLFGELDR